MSTDDKLTIKCLGCGRPVTVPAGSVKQAFRIGRPYPVFCSRKCNSAYVAREGIKLQKALEELQAHDS